MLTARTTVDVRLQQAADQALVSTIRQYEREKHATSGASAGDFAPGGRG